MAKSKWIWIREDVVYAIHKRQLAEHGGLDGVRDRTLLESAMARPINLALCERGRVDIADLSSAYAAGIAKNHPFVDGNNRTAHVLYQLFLELNGYFNEWTNHQKYQAMLQLAAGDINEAQFSSLLQSTLKRRN